MTEIQLNDPQTLYRRWEEAQWSPFAIDLANTLRDLPVRSAEQLELLIASQGEVRDRRRSAGDPSWPLVTNLLEGF